ncbi:MAG TPA: hypothetical protein VGI39_01590 [Polyangiaceae bacterium]|jgi:hypothetical protein
MRKTNLLSTLLPCVLLSLTGCSGGNELARDAGNDVDATPSCPTTAPAEGSACSSPGQGCNYDNYTPGAFGCYCVCPELTWICCHEAIQCGADPTHPQLTVGAPCCVGTTDPGAFETCGWCSVDNVELDLTCSVSDPHWRQSEKACVHPTYDAGGDAPLD